MEEEFEEEQEVDESALFFLLRSSYTLAEAPVSADSPVTDGPGGTFFALPLFVSAVDCWFICCRRSSSTLRRLARSFLRSFLIRSISRTDWRCFEVRVALRWGAILPAGISLQQFDAPFVLIERRIGDDEVGLQVTVLIL